MPRLHITKITNSAKSRIHMVKRCFSNHSEEVILPLYKTIIRPILEYASPTWSPWLQKDIDSLERMQRRCLRLCGDRVNLESLKARRDKQDLVETYKYLHGYYKTDSTKLFTRCLTSRTRGHPYKLFQHRARRDLRKNFFCNRVVSSWNKLSTKQASAPTVDNFKKLSLQPKG